MSKAKKTTSFKTEAEERAFWESQDSSQYVDWNKAKPAVFPNLKPSTKTISLRLPEGLLERIKVEANKLFGRWAFRAGIQTNPKRIAKAHNQLMKNLSSKSLKQDILGLPKENK